MTSVLAERRIDTIAPTREDRTFAVLEYLHQLLQCPETAASNLAGLLGHLATVFAADGAGLAVTLGTTPIAIHHYGADRQPRCAARYPWEERAELFEQVRSAASGIPVQTSEPASWLLAGCSSPHGEELIVWLDCSERRSWSAREAATLALAGQVLSRLAGSPLKPTLERARTQRGLEQAATITSRLAHDFGNLLTGVLGFAELGLSQLPGDSLPYRHISEVVQAGKNGTQWIQNLQLFSRRRATEFWPCTLASVVAEEEARLRPTWSEKVALHVALASDLPPIALDKESLRHVLAQLLDNAREAISEQGVVTVTASVRQMSVVDCHEVLGNAAAGTFVEMIFTDTGCGLSAQAQQRLLRELFFSSKPRHRGLGLAIVYGILRTFHGGLRFGPHPAQGTAVHVFLPIAPATGRTMLPGERTGPRILLVVDDPLLARHLTGLMERDGYRVQTASGALEAAQLHLSATAPFRLVVAEQRLAYLNGFDLVRRLRETQPDIAALCLGSDKEEKTIVPDADFAGVDLLAKPFRPEALLQRIRKALEPGRSGPRAAQSGETEKGS